MADDRPAFLNSIPTNPEEEEIQSVLHEDSDGGEGNNTPDKPEDTQETPKPDSEKEQEKSDKDTTSEKAGETDGRRDGEEKGKEEDNKAGKGEDEGKPEGEKPKPEQPPKLYGGKYKSVEEMEAALKELENSVEKVKKPVELSDFDKDIELVLKQPVVQPQLPNPEHYYLDGPDGQRQFDLNTYMADYTNNLVMEFQRQLVGGPLSALQFGLIQKAMSEEHSNTLQEAQRAEQAADILDRLFTKFPILRDSEEHQDKMERLIYGEQARRQRMAEAENKDVDPMTYEDYEKLAVEIVGSAPPPQEKPQEPTENLKGSPPIGDKSTPKSDVDQDIDEMMSKKNFSMF